MKKETKIVLLIFLVAFLLIGIVVVFVIDQNKAVSNDESVPYINPYSVTPALYTVMYKVDGIGKASVTMENAQGGTEQYDVTTPWTYTLYGMHSGDWVYISAQADSEYGYLDVYIYLNGTEVKHSHSNGAYCIATASGTI